MKAVLVAGGCVNEKKLQSSLDGAYIVAADSGAEALYKLSIKPDLLIGDFDSISPDLLDFMRKEEIECIHFPPKKDASDSELALSILKERGYNEIYFFGALGGRLDHTVANLFLIYRFYEEGVRVYLRGDSDACILTGKHEVKCATNYFSLFRISPEKTTISIHGSKYDVERVELAWGSSLGLSNEHKEDIVSITIHEGAALYIETNEYRNQ